MAASYHRDQSGLQNPLLTQVYSDWLPLTAGGRFSCDHMTIFSLCDVIQVQE